MPTVYLMSEGGVLRHGHPMTEYDPKMQWHAAVMVHRDPTIHERENSWDLAVIRWSNQGRYVSYTQHNDLIRQAHAEHDANASSESTAIFHDDDAASTSTSTDDTDIDTSDLVSRVDALENIAIQTAQRADAAKSAAERASTDAGTARTAAANVGLNVNTLERRLSELTPRVALLEAQTAAKPIEIIIRTPVATKHHTGTFHACFEKLLTLASALEPEDRNIWISGPAGSGKTTAARQLAEILEVPFDFHGAIDSPYKLSGFIDGYGKYHDTAFRRIYEHGGVILLDEVDGGSAGALLEINAAIANTHASFPDGQIRRHENTYVLCAANTWGFGGDSNYVGRNKLDAAFLDRFVTISWPYDETLEACAAGVPVPTTARLLPAQQLTTTNTPEIVSRWVAVVQTVRHELEKAGAQIVISPRASIKGAQLLRGGVTPALVVEAIFGRYRTHSIWPSVGVAAETFAKQHIASTNGAVAPVDKPKTSGLTVDMSGVRVFDSR